MNSDKWKEAEHHSPNKKRGAKTFRCGKAIVVLRMFEAKTLNHSASIGPTSISIHPTNISWGIKGY